MLVPDVSFTARRMAPGHFLDERSGDPSLLRIVPCAHPPR